MTADLSHVEAWIFDLDNTLYPASCNLFAQVDERMSAYIRRTLGLTDTEARRLQKDYYHRHGTTLNGLMREHGLDPAPFLDYVHDIDLSSVEANDGLRAGIARLPGRRYIHTNGSREHAVRVLGQLGVGDLFDDVFCITAAGFRPKPLPAAYDAFIRRFGVAPSAAAMFEDLARNLVVPHEIGMTTVLVEGDKAWEADGPVVPSLPGDYVHHRTDDLVAFLCGIAVGAQGAAPGVAGPTVRAPSPPQER